MLMLCLQVTCSQAPVLGPGAQDVLALVGCFTFKAGTVLAAVTKAEKVSASPRVVKVRKMCQGGVAPCHHLGRVSERSGSGELNQIDDAISDSLRVPCCAYASRSGCLVQLPLHRHPVVRNKN
jgi:hypothetical protein